MNNTARDFGNKNLSERQVFETIRPAKVVLGLKFAKLAPLVNQI